MPGEEVHAHQALEVLFQIDPFFKGVAGDGMERTLNMGKAFGGPVGKRRASFMVPSMSCSLSKQHQIMSQFLACSALTFSPRSAIPLAWVILVTQGRTQHAERLNKIERTGRQSSG